MTGYYAKVTIVLKEKRWVFPKDRFVEYEPKDEVWARALGYGHEENRREVVLPCTMIRSVTTQPRNNLIETDVLLTYVENPVLFKEQS